MELNLLEYFLVDDAWAKFSAIRLAICFSLKAFVLPRERWFIEVWTVLFDIFFTKFQIVLGLVFEFIFAVKFLQEDLLASLIVRLVLALCCLYLSRFSDEGLVLNFLRILWRSLIIVLHSSVNQGLLCFGDVVVLGMVLFAILIRVFVKCVIGSSWFVFVSGIRVSRHSFL